MKPEPGAHDEREARLVDAARIAVDRSSESTQAAGQSPTGGPAEQEIPADAIAGFELIREIHRGGQGVVYLAHQKSTNRRVAIKVTREGPFAGARDRARFEREVHILAQLNHPNIVTIHDSGRAAGFDYFVMDYISGQSLDTFVSTLMATPKRAGKPDGEDESGGSSGARSSDSNAPAIAVVPNTAAIPPALMLFATICDAVDAAHKKGVIHRDLKPGNIRIDNEGRPHILDFGLARTLLSASDAPELATATGQFVGSLPWASPEQAEGLQDRVDARTDVYSLGIVLYQMLTGRFPYKVTGSMRSVIDRIVGHEPIRPRSVNAAVSRDVETILLHCLHKSPDRRYADAGAIAADIRRTLRGEPIVARGDSPIYRTSVRTRAFLTRRPAVRVCANVAIATAVATFVAAPLAFRWTRANDAFESFATTRAFPNAAGTHFEQVRIIRLSRQTKPDELATSEHLEGVDAKDAPKSLRRLHGRLLEKLAQAGARVVAFDIEFPGVDAAEVGDDAARAVAEYDADFVRGVNAMHSAGGDVAVAIANWNLGDDHLPLPEQLSPALRAGRVKWGSSRAGFVGAPWDVDLALQCEREDARPSLAAAALAAMLHPDADVSLRIDAPDDTVEFRFATSATGGAGRVFGGSEIVRVTNVQPASPEARTCSPADVVGQFAIVIPSDAVLDGVVKEYADVIRMTDHDRADWARNKLIVVGDFRTTADTFPYGPGRLVHGSFGHAVAMDWLLRQTRTRFPGMFEGMIICAIAAMIGLLAVQVVRGPALMCIAVLVAGGLVVITSICLYPIMQLLCNPIVPVVALLASAVLRVLDRRYVIRSFTNVE